MSASTPKLRSLRSLRYPPPAARRGRTQRPGKAGSAGAHLSIAL
jgi:hypothetical protein